MENTAFVIVLHNDISDKDRTLLLQIINKVYAVPVNHSRNLGGEWDLFVAFVKGIGEVAITTSAVITLAKELRDWRDKIKKEKSEISINVILQKPEEIPLNLDTATEDEIITWLLSNTNGMES